MALPPLAQHDTLSMDDKAQTKEIVVAISTNPPDDIADGGIRAWMSVVGGWIVSFCTFGFAQSFGVFEDYYTLSAGTSSPSNVAWIGSFQLFMMFAMGLLSGRLYDLGYFRHLQIGGALIFLFSLFMLSLVNTSKYYQIFLSQGIGIGLGCGLMYLPALSVQAQHWKKRRSLAMGIVVSGSSIGGIIFPIMHNQLLHSSVGFAWTVRTSGFMMLFLLCIANTLFSTPHNIKNHTSKPSVGVVFHNSSAMVCAAACFLVFWGLYFPYFYIQLYASIHNLPQDVSFYTLSILNASSTLGRIVPNILADKYGNMNVNIPLCFLNGALVFAMLGVKDTAGVIVFSILYGFTSGGFISVVGPQVAAFASGLHEVGIYMGIGFFMVSWANLTGTPIAGKLLGNGHFTWYKPILFSAVIMTVGGVFMLISRMKWAAHRGTQFV